MQLETGLRHQAPLAQGFHLAYRRPKSEQAGVWSARWKDPAEQVDKLSRLGDADDCTEADGTRILSYAQVQRKAEAWFKQASSSQLRRADAILQAQVILARREPILGWLRFPIYGDHYGPFVARGSSTTRICNP